MIDTNELRRLAQAAISKMSTLDPEFVSSVTPLAVLELLDRLEAAESECLEQARLNGMGASREAALLAGGYMDIGTDLTDEALAALPKGRHMLGIVGTYGVDGYVPAQPAPSVPDGWKEAAIAWEVCASIHREYGKGKDPFFNTRQGDFVKHANDARAMLAAAAPEAKP